MTWNHNNIPISEPNSTEKTMKILQNLIDYSATKNFFTKRRSKKSNTEENSGKLFQAWSLTNVFLTFCFINLELANHVYCWSTITSGTLMVTHLLCTDFLWRSQKTTVSFDFKVLHFTTTIFFYDFLKLIEKVNFYE